MDPWFRAGHREGKTAGILGEGNGMSRTTEVESKKFSFGFELGGKTVIVEEIWVVRLMGT